MNEPEKLNELSSSEKNANEIYNAQKKYEPEKLNELSSSEKNANENLNVRCRVNDLSD